MWSDVISELNNACSYVVVTVQPLLTLGVGGEVGQQLRGCLLWNLLPVNICRREQSNLTKICGYTHVRSISKWHVKCEICQSCCELLPSKKTWSLRGPYPPIWSQPNLLEGSSTWRYEKGGQQKVIMVSGVTGCFPLVSVYCTIALEGLGMIMVSHGY